MKDSKNIISNKVFKYGFIIWIIIFCIGLVNKVFQNDTFYTIKIGELIFKNGIDMMDHFSFHSNLAYTYPHWLYDCFIYVIYNNFGFLGLYVSSIILFIILLLCLFHTCKILTNNYMVAAFGTIICALAASGFVTARAQLITFILFILEILFIEMFIKKKDYKYLFGLFAISLIICNVHVAVWPFYFILYLPYLAEYGIAIICNKIKLKKENKVINFLKKKVIIEKNDNVKYLFIILILSILTGLITPIGNTPYTYLFKTMIGNSQKYIQEHHMIGWRDSPFTIIMTFETIFLFIMSRAKLRDLFLMGGLVLMSIVSIRHLSLLAILGTISFTRIFSMFFEYYKFDIDHIILTFFTRKSAIIGAFVLVIIFSFFMIKMQVKKEYVDHKLYPTEAVKYIKNNIDYKNMRVFNEYDFGSYLLFNDIPVFIDSRADLYTRQFSGFDYDIFDDFYYMMGNYRNKFSFYGITHILFKKEKNNFYPIIDKDSDYNKIYEDEYFVLYEKVSI